MKSCFFHLWKIYINKYKLRLIVNHNFSSPVNDNFTVTGIKRKLLESIADRMVDSDRSALDLSVETITILISVESYEKLADNYRNFYGDEKRIISKIWKISSQIIKMGFLPPHHLLCFLVSICFDKKFEPLTSYQWVRRSNPFEHRVGIATISGYFHCSGYFLQWHFFFFTLVGIFTSHQLLWFLASIYCHPRSKSLISHRWVQ